MTYDLKCCWICNGQEVVNKKEHDASKEHVRAAKILFNNGWIVQQVVDGKLLLTSLSLTFKDHVFTLHPYGIEEDTIIQLSLPVSIYQFNSVFTISNDIMKSSPSLTMMPSTDIKIVFKTMAHKISFVEHVKNLVAQELTWQMQDKTNVETLEYTSLVDDVIITTTKPFQHQINTQGNNMESSTTPVIKPTTVNANSPKHFQSSSPDNSFFTQELELLLKKPTAAKKVQELETDIMDALLK